MKFFRKTLTYILPVLAVIMVIGLILSRVYQPEPSSPDPEIRVSAHEAAEHAGTFAEVCGNVASADYVPGIGGEPTFLNLGEPHPDQLFTVVIWGEDRQRWPVPPDERYLTRDICVTGEITMHEGTPQIRARYPDQITSN